MRERLNITLRGGYQKDHKISQGKLGVNTGQKMSAYFLMLHYAKSFLK